LEVSGEAQIIGFLVHEYHFPIEYVLELTKTQADFLVETVMFLNRQTRKAARKQSGGNSS